MTVAAMALPVPKAGVRFAKVFPRFDELGAAGQRLWMFLWEKTRFGTQPARVTDREMAAACGRGIRWVQKALRQLLDLEEDGTPTPVVDRFRQYGPRHIAGRIIQIIVDWAEPRAKAAEEAATKGPTRPTRGGGSIPNVGAIRETTPEQLAATQALLEAAAGAPPEPTAEELEALERFNEDSRRRREATERRKSRPRIELDPAPRDPSAPGASGQAILEARRREQAARDSIPPPGSIQAGLEARAKELRSRAVPDPDDSS